MKNEIEKDGFVTAYPDINKDRECEKENIISLMLTKREQFAMAAMQAIISATNSPGYFESNVAKNAIKMADALIEELENSNV